MVGKPEITILRRDLAHQSAHAEALGKGMRAHGVEVRMATPAHVIKTKYTACWGWRMGVRLRRAGHEVLVMERGYIGDRFSYTSLGWNGLNGFAMFPDRGVDGGERFAAHGGRLLPWKNDGKCVLILGQVPRDASLRGIDLIPQYEAWAMDAKKRFGLPVFFRPHPDVVKKGLVQQIAFTERSPHESLSAALSEAALCITFNSNSGVDAVIAGVPTITFDSGSMAWEVCGHDIGKVIRPDRELWAYKLAYKQWSIDEISSGAALEPLAERIRHG